MSVVLIVFGIMVVDEKLLIASVWSSVVYVDTSALKALNVVVLIEGYLFTYTHYVAEFWRTESSGAETDDPVSFLSRLADAGLATCERAVSTVGIRRKAIVMCDNIGKQSGLVTY